MLGVLEGLVPADPRMAQAIRDLAGPANGPLLSLMACSPGMAPRIPKPIRRTAYAP